MPSVSTWCAGVEAVLTGTEAKLIRSIFKAVNVINPDGSLLSYINGSVGLLVFRQVGGISSDYWFAKSTNRPVNLWLNGTRAQCELGTVVTSTQISPRDSILFAHVSCGICRNSTNFTPNPTILAHYMPGPDTLKEETRVLESLPVALVTESGWCPCTVDSLTFRRSCRSWGLLPRNQQRNLSESRHGWDQGSFTRISQLQANQESAARIKAKVDGQNVFRLLASFSDYSLGVYYRQSTIARQKVFEPRSPLQSTEGCSC